MNSAETHVDIFNSDTSATEEKPFTDKKVTFISESGMMEFFLIGNSIKNGGPKRI